MSALLTTTNDRLANIHPGEILEQEFMVPMGITAYRLAKETGMPQTRISQIIKGRRSITADTALRLSRYFGTTARFWMNLQAAYDLEEIEGKESEELNKIKQYAAV